MPLPHIAVHIIRSMLVNQAMKQVPTAWESFKEFDRRCDDTVRGAWKGFKEFDRKCDEWVRRNW
jgi:hypothetical protein